MDSTAFLQSSFLLAVVFIKEKSIMLSNKSQFCAFEMENNQISPFIQAVKNQGLQTRYLVQDLCSYHICQFTWCSFCMVQYGCLESCCQKVLPQGTYTVKGGRVFTVLSLFRQMMQPIKLHHSASYPLQHSSDLFPKKNRLFVSGTERFRTLLGQALMTNNSLLPYSGFWVWEWEQFKNSHLQRGICRKCSTRLMLKKTSRICFD